MNEQTGSVTGVICTHDARRWDAVSRAVASLREQTRPLDELIVVVDHNPQLLARVEAEHPDVLVIPNRHQAGLSGARNTAAETAKSTFVAFLDDDAAAAPDWIERLVSECADPDVLGAGGRVTPRWLGRRPRWFPDEFLWVVGCTYEGMPRRKARVRNLYGGCFCIRREVLLELGGFRTELGRVGSNRMGCEETELCIRAGARWPGSSFRYDPDALIEHDVPDDRARWSYFRSRCFAEGVSKARLTRLVGADAGLASERAYVLRTLPSAAVRQLGRGLVHRDMGPLGAAAAIVTGLAVTSIGYALELARFRKEPR